MAKLVVDGITRKLPDPMPTDAEGLLELMNDAAAWAAGALPGSPRFEAGRLYFEAASGHYNLVISREMAAAHHGLTRATKKLNVATIVLVAATVLLAVVTFGLVAAEFGKPHGSSPAAHETPSPSTTQASAAAEATAPPATPTPAPPSTTQAAAPRRVPAAKPSAPATSVPR